MGRLVTGYYVSEICFVTRLLYFRELAMLPTAFATSTTVPGMQILFVFLVSYLPNHFTGLDSVKLLLNLSTLGIKIIFLDPCFEIERIFFIQSNQNYF